MVSQQKKGADIDAIITILRGYLALPSNWNGYDGIAPPSAAVDDCIRFLRDLGAIPVRPSPMVSGDGEVGLFWEGAGVTIESGFRGDGRYSYLAEFGGASWGEEGVPLANVSVFIRKALARIS